jgi:outer membrane translocation and assembly module TamA
MCKASCIVLAASLLAAAASAQTPQTAETVLVRTLTLTATDKPGADWRPVTASVQGNTFTLEELQDRIQQKLRDNGYYFAHLGTPQLTNVRPEASKRSADVTVQLEAGDQFTIGQITFKHTTQFKKEQLRSDFPITTGSVFNGSAIATGLDKVKALYEAEGFADVGAVPSMAVDENAKVIDVSIEVEEGYPYLFGQLSLEGAEPTPGTSKALLTAWSEVAGKRYNPETLKKWLAAHAPKSAPGAPAIHPHAEGIADTEAHLMNVRLVF